MQKFFMIIGKNKLNVYSTNGGQWESSILKEIRSLSMR